MTSRPFVNFLAMSGASAAAVVIGLAVNIYVRRTLGPEAIGQVNWNLALLSYLGLVANPGLQLVGTIEIARHRDEAARIVGLVTVLQLGLAGAAYSLVLALAWLAPLRPQIGLLLAWQGLSIFLTAVNLDWALRGQERMIATSVVSLLLNLAQLPAAILLIHGPEDVTIFAVLAMPFTLMAAAFNYFYWRRAGARPLAGARPSWAEARRLFRNARPFALSQLAVMICLNSGSVILGLVSNDREVGLYSTAARLVFMTTMISGALYNAYLPHLARLRDDGQAAGRFLRLIAAIGLPLAALGWVFGQGAIDVIYGAAFAGAGSYFQFLSLSVALTFVNIGIGLPLQAWGFQDRLLRINLLAAGVTVIANLVLIPLYGAYGAIAAALAAEALVLGLQIRLRHRLGLDWNPIMSRANFAPCFRPGSIPSPTIRSTAPASSGATRNG